MEAPARPMPFAITPRLLSIDALRGLTIAFMILVNDPGDWAHIYAPLEHSPWNGWTPTDLVFPSFLFLVGCAIVLSLSARTQASRTRTAWRIVRRAATLFAIKMFLSAYPHFHLRPMRLYGVLTRIALCYLAVGLLYLYVRSWRVLAAVTAALLAGYWVLLRWVPVPGLGMPVRDFPLLDAYRNLAAWLDRSISAFTLHWLHTGTLYEHTRDPEGLLSTLPAIATTLLGVLAALWLRQKPSPGSSRLRNGLLGAGAVSIALGELWGRWFPINKNLWTSSYVLLAGGISMVLLGAAYWLLDDRPESSRATRARRMAWPLLVFGSNAIVAFVVSELLIESLLAIAIQTADGRTIPASTWLYHTVFVRSGSSNPNTSLAFAVVYVLVCFLPNWWLWRRRLFLRV